MPAQHHYKGLDDFNHPNARVSIAVPMRHLAEMVDHCTYGVHMFLSHLIDVREEKLKARIADYEANGDDDVAEYARDKGDELANAIKELLEKGLY